MKDTVDAIYLSHQLGMRKPESSIFQHVLHAESVSPQQTVFFDDLSENIQAANLLGMGGIEVSSEATVPVWFKEHLNLSI